MLHWTYYPFSEALASLEGISADVLITLHLVNRYAICVSSVVNSSQINKKREREKLQKSRHVWFEYLRLHTERLLIEKCAGIPAKFKNTRHIREIIQLNARTTHIQRKNTAMHQTGKGWRITKGWNKCTAAVEIGMVQTTWVSIECGARSQHMGKLF